MKKSSNKKKEKLVRMKFSDIPKKMSEEQIKRLEAIKDEDIDYSDIPDFDVSFWKNAQVIQFMPRPKKAISIRLQESTLEWFKSQGKGYQTFISSLLDSYVDAQKNKKSNSKKTRH